MSTETDCGSEDIAGEALFERRKRAMVEEQMKRRGITNRRVLDAFMKIPRHLFVPLNARESAYEDHPLSIGESQTISQPYMVALMTQELMLEGTEKVLEIGTGSGYQTAVLAELAGRVFTVERIGTLGSRAQVVLDGLGYGNIVFRTGDGTLGLPDSAPFDRIIVTAGAPEVPRPLKDQLADGGLLVIPVGRSCCQMLMSLRRNGSSFEEREVLSCVFVRLIGREGWGGEE